jgi:hypothetical protein
MDQLFRFLRHWLMLERIKILLMGIGEDIFCSLVSLAGKAHMIVGAQLYRSAATKVSAAAPQ